MLKIFQLFIFSHLSSMLIMMLYSLNWSTVFHIFICKWWALQEANIFVFTSCKACCLVRSSPCGERGDRHSGTPHRPSSEMSYDLIARYGFTGDKRWVTICNWKWFHDYMTGVCACACIFLYYSARGDINVHTESQCVGMLSSWGRKESMPTV